MVDPSPLARGGGTQGWGIAPVARRAVVYLLLVAGAAVMLVPFAYMVGISFTPNAFVLQTPPTFIPASPTLDNYAAAWNGNNFGSGLLQ